MSSRFSVDSTVDANEDSAPDWASASPAVENADLAAERTYSRRRSLECCSVELSIVGTETTQGHTLYIIQVSSGIKQWEVGRRYRDFSYLDKQLRKNFPKLKIGVLPPKRYLFSSTDPTIVDERRIQLEDYLKALIYLPTIWTRNDLVLFLNNDSNAMMFIWNFERMRKMQDVRCCFLVHNYVLVLFADQTFTLCFIELQMLSSMTVENQTETAKLNSDLTLARTQVCYFTSVHIS